MESIQGQRGLILSNGYGSPGSPGSVGSRVSGASVTVKPKIKTNERNRLNASRQACNPCFCCCCACCNLRANCAAIGLFLIAWSIVEATFTAGVPDFCTTGNCGYENTYIIAELIFVTLGWLTCLTSGISLLLAVCLRRSSAALTAGIFILLSAAFILIKIIIQTALYFYISERISGTQDGKVNEIFASMTILVVVISIHSFLHGWMIACCFALRLQIQCKLDRRAHVPPQFCDVEDIDVDEDKAPGFQEVPQQVN